MKIKAAVLGVLLLNSLAGKGLAEVKPVQISLLYEGTKLRANGAWWIPEKVDPTRTGTILWLHGTLQSHQMREPIQAMASRWMEAGIPVLAITLTLGIDDRKEPYDCSVPHRHTYKQIMAELTAWIEWLKARNVRKVVLAGHSRGGQQVILFAAQRSDPTIKGVLGVAPSVGQPSDHPALETARKLFFSGKRDSLITTDFLFCRNTKVSARTLLSYYETRQDIREVIPKLKVPVMIAVGSEDEILGDVAGKLKDVAKQPNVTIETIDFADHFFRDMAADDLADVTVPFIKQWLGIR